MIPQYQLEQQCLGWFRDGGWETVFGPDIAHDGCQQYQHEQQHDHEPEDDDDVGDHDHNDDSVLIQNNSRYAQKETNPP